MSRPGGRGLRSGFRRRRRSVFDVTRRASAPSPRLREEGMQGVIPWGFTIFRFLLRFCWRPAAAPPATWPGAFASVWSGLLLVLLGALALLQANVAAQWWPRGEPFPTAMADDDQWFAVALGAVAIIGLCGVLAVGCARRKEALCALAWTVALVILVAGPVIEILIRSRPGGGSMLYGRAVLLFAQALTFGRGVVGRTPLNALAIAALAFDGELGNQMLGTQAPDVFTRAPFAASALFWGLHLIWRGWAGSFLALRSPPSAGTRSPA